jgi:hypothetical protein
MKVTAALQKTPFGRGSFAYAQKMANVASSALNSWAQLRRKTGPMHLGQQLISKVAGRLLVVK